MEKATKRKKILSMIEELNFKINTYDSTYSDSDEFTNKESLENELFKLSIKLKEVEKV